MIDMIYDQKIPFTLKTSQTGVFYFQEILQGSKENKYKKPILSL